MCVTIFSEKNMFNMTKHTKSAQKPYEKYLRDDNLGPKADDSDPIGEKKLPHREGYEQTLTESQLKDKHEWGDNEKAKPIEAALESATSNYVKHRSDAADLCTPPINVLVEKMRQKRLAEDYKVDKNAHWSHTFNEKTQQGSLPKTPKNAPQHNKHVLGNDPDRFSGTNTDPVNFHTETIHPLVGNITTADVNKIASNIKTGQSSEYDNAIMAILRLAHTEKRELSDIERKTVVDLKVARTTQMMQK